MRRPAEEKAKTFGNHYSTFLNYTLLSDPQALNAMAVAWAKKEERNGEGCSVGNARSNRAGSSYLVQLCGRRRQFSPAMENFKNVREREKKINGMKRREVGEAR
ncbi:hypothetical protein QOT17_001513 [Balamuthia mandrillaris]